MSVESVVGGADSGGAAAGLDLGCDALDGIGKIVVLPNAYHYPSARFQGGSSVLVALRGSGEFRTPVPVVNVWLAAVLRACVPEARVVEDSNFGPREDDVRPWLGAFREKQPVVLTESKAAGVKEGSKTQFRTRVYPPNSLLVAGPAFGCRAWHNAAFVGFLPAGGGCAALLACYVASRMSP